MTPEYLRELANLADPEKLWSLPGLQQMELPPEKRRQRDMGVALRRHANHIEQLRELIGTGRSLLITPLSANGSARTTVPTPAKHRQLMD